MQRSLLAALVAISLGACDSDDSSVPLSNNVVDIPVVTDPVVTDPVVADDNASGGGASDDGASQGDADTSDDVNVIVVGGNAPQSDNNDSSSDQPQAPAPDTDTDAGSNTDPSGSNNAGGAASDPADNDASGDDQVAPDPVDSNPVNSNPVDTGSSNSGDGNTGGTNNDASDSAGSGGDDQGSNGAGSGISDDAGSATSDGGETASGGDQGGGANDQGDNSNTGGNISDDAGSATSDGGETGDDGADQGNGAGQNTDDSGSATSDGGQIQNDDSNTGGGQDSDAGNTPPNTGGGSGQQADDFESDNAGGSLIRRSVLSAAGQQNICTTASDQQNFSDTRVGDFILHNNAWRPWRAAPGYEWSQCIYTNTNGALVGWNYDWGPGISGLNGNPNPSGDYYVRSYPELIYGVKDEFRTSAPKSVTGFPVPMSEMPNIAISYSYDGPQYGESRAVDASNNARFPNGTIISGERNIAVESFLYNPDANGECAENIVTRNGGSNHVYEVMVWLDAGAERLPAGPSDFVTNVNIRGEAYKVYTKGSDNRYIAFVAQNPQTSGTLFWNDFTDWARTFAHRVSEEFGARSNSVQIQDSWCVANIIVGTEIFWGAGNLDIFDWTITQTQ